MNALLSYYFFLASKTILHVFNDCAQQSTPGSIQYINSYTVNFWGEDLFIGQHHSLTLELSDELCSFVNNCPLLRGASQSRAPEGGRPTNKLPVCLSLPVANKSFFPRSGICSSKAHPENTNVHLTTGRSMCMVLVFSLDGPKNTYLVFKVMKSFTS